MIPSRYLVILILLVCGIVASMAAAFATVESMVPSAAVAPTGIHKIRHVVVIMMENRSFDEYFGTYPGADGLPRNKQGQ